MGWVFAVQVYGSGTRYLKASVARERVTYSKPAEEMKSVKNATVRRGLSYSAGGL